MRIQIAQRFTPFSHQPGIFCLLPGTSLRLQIFPAYLCIDDLAESQPRRIAQYALNVRGLVRDFTVLQDLEKGKVRVWGHAVDGYFCYSCQLYQGRVMCKVEKAPSGYFNDWPLHVPLNKTHTPDRLERLSLGCHKGQEWELMQGRLLMEEIFPLWMRAGEWVPSFPVSIGGAFALLEDCKAAVLACRPEKIIPAFQRLYSIGFNGMLSPTLFDEKHQGLNLPCLIDPKASPLALLREGASLIRSLFIQSKQDEHLLRILAALPPEFHSGRLTDALCPGLGVCSIEWSKKRIRRLIMHTDRLENGKQRVAIHFQNCVKSFRLRQGNNDRGCRMLTDQLLQLEPNQHYFIDNFQD